MERTKTSNAGTGAHITAASVGGPRYDASLSENERRSAANGIWCCRDCGKLVDDDVITFSLDQLRGAKARAIERAHRALLTGDTDPDGYRKEARAPRQRIANDVTRAVYAVRTEMPGLWHAWHKWRVEGSTNLEPLVRSLDTFRSAVDAVKKARDEVRALWGEYVAAPLQTFGDICSGLHTSVVMDLRGVIPKVICDRDYEDAGDHGRRREEILDFASLIEDWAAPYLGREGAAELTEDELEARRWRIAGFPEDQVVEMVESSRFFREARRAGRTRAEIKKLAAERDVKRRPTRALSIAPLGYGGIDAQTIVDEIHRLALESVARGESTIIIRLPEPCDSALERTLMEGPGGEAVLSEIAHKLAEQHPEIQYLQIHAGGLPASGWKFGKRS